jgi:type II secretion system protein N
VSGLLASAPPAAAGRFRIRRVLLFTLGYVALTLLFVLLRFPIDRLTPRVEALASAASGAQVSIGGLEFHLVALLPELSALDAVVTWPAHTRLQLDRVRVRPAWSLSWLRGDPSLALSVRRAAGRVRGVARFGDTPGFRGAVTAVDLMHLPPALLGDAGVAFDGKLDGEVDLRMADTGPEGAVTLRASDGSLSLPMLPMGVPFESFEGALQLGGDVLVTVQSLALEGPLVALTGSGTVGRAATSALAPLALAARLEVREPALRQLFANGDITLGPDGVAELSIGGTLSNPVVTGDRGGAGARGLAPPRGPRRR